MVRVLPIGTRVRIIMNLYNSDETHQIVEKGALATVVSNEEDEGINVHVDDTVMTNLALCDWEYELLEGK
jgi:hypothetical protein